MIPRSELENNLTIMRTKRIGILTATLLAGIATMVWLHALPKSAKIVPDEASLQAEIPRLQEEIKQLTAASSRLSKSFARFQQGKVIAVDTAKNRLYLLEGSKVILDAPCSTGSGLSLDDPAEGRKWVFRTPRGEFHVISKLNNPVWRKPDWAFVELGERPPIDSSLRFETGVLGEYALAFGDGFFIHGTLYTRLLGRNVTHGCIRLGDEDLERLVRQVPVGTPVLIT